jgi:hypothetical protein
VGVYSMLGCANRFLRSRIFSGVGYCYDSSYHGIKVTSLQIKSASLQYCFHYITELLAFKQRIAACVECEKHEEHGYYFGGS